MAITPAHDVVNSSPTNTFATFQANYSIYHPTLSEGNTKIIVNAGNTHQHIIGTMTFQQGNIYYFELATPTTSGDSQNFGIVGITKMLAAEHTSNSQNRSLLQLIPYPKICFECRGAMIIDQTTIQDWGTSSYSADSNLAIANFSTDSDKFIYDNTLDPGQANTLEDAATGTITPSFGNGYLPKWTDSGNKVFGVLLNFTATDYGSISFTMDGTNWSTPFTKIKLNTGISWTLGAGGYGGNVSGQYDEWRVNCGDDPTFAGLVSSSGNAPANGIGSFYYNISSTNAVSLCTSNLPASSIDVASDDLPEDHFKCVKWTGTDDTSNSITTVGFQPDLVWAKSRSHGYSNLLYDSVRGAGANKELTSDSAVAEGAGNPDTHGHLSAFTSNGFSSTTGNTGNYYFNGPSTTYVAWCWKAGGAPSGATSATGSAKRINSSGTQDDTSCSALATAATSAGASNVITPTLMSINQKSGFSIVKYNTGQTGHLTGGPYSIPHGLGAEPTFIIIKSIDNNAYDWLVYHKSVGNVNYTQLNNTYAFSTGDSATYAGSNTEYVVNIGGTQVVAANGDYIMYSWAPVEGFSAFGSYDSNESADGPYIFCGFKPALVWIKSNASGLSSDSQSYASWTMFDNAREPNNVMSNPLYANKSAGEGYRGNGSDSSTSIKIDFLSNGFKIRAAFGEINGTAGDQMVYACWAEMPFKYSATNAR